MGSALMSDAWVTRVIKQLSLHNCTKCQKAELGESSKNSMKTVSIYIRLPLDSVCRSVSSLLLMLQLCESLVVWVTD